MLSRLASLFRSSLVLVSLVAALPACDPAGDAGAPRVSMSSAPIYASDQGEVSVDIDGAQDIDAVRLTVDGELLAESAAPPFALSFATERLAEGAYELEAVAITAAGLEGRAGAKLIVDRTPPDVEAEVVPADDDSAAGVQFNASDENPLRLTRLVVRNRHDTNVQVYSCTASPRVAFTGCGELILSFNAEDAAGNHSMSELEYEAGPKVAEGTPRALCHTAQVVFPTGSCSPFTAIGVDAGTR